ncbi:hypothetical protein [Helicobacter bizzozeronii]|uniref:hypothetical protein n=1 Tax=Helicobacter bizzozeronii TaxID=56877 RepID=UPI000CEECB0B|nr:hypothetical protein [Helicobacter bizzozeronii]
MRFFVLALLLGTLGATTPSALLEIAQKIQTTMATATATTSPEDDLSSDDAVINSLPIIQKLGLEFLNQVPLLQEFNPHNEKEAHFVGWLKNFEMLHLFALIAGYTADPDKKPPLSQIINDYLKVLDFIYGPLIKAHQQGLDLNVYIKALRTLPSDPKSWDDTVHYFTTNRQVKPKPMLPVQAFFEDFKIVELAYRLIKGGDTQAILGELLSWGYANTYAINNLGFESDCGDAVDTKEYQKLYAPYYAQYNVRLAEFLYESYYYTFDDPLSRPQLDVATLQKHPQLCLKPKYLRQKFKQACLDILQKGTYKTQTIEDYFKIIGYLQTIPLVNVDNSPCLAHNAQGKLQKKFKSKNPFCVALQNGL